jgi:membrane protein implicated in regulation of membrane protease activity
MIAAVLDLGIDLNVWPWVWLFVGVFFAVIELTVLAGSFVLLPFAVSAFAAALLGFYDVAIEIQWAVFIVGGGVLWVLLYKRVMKFAGDNETAPGVGANRLVGLTAIVTAEIDPDDTDRRGRVKVESEVWNALTHAEHAIPIGAKVHIDDMQGTRVIVTPISAPPPTTPPLSPPQAQTQQPPEAR